MIFYVNYSGFAYWVNRDCTVCKRIENSENILIRSEVVLSLPLLSSTDREEWETAKKEVFALFPGRSDLGRLLWKNAKLRFIAAQRKSWEDVLPKEIVNWAWGVLNEESKGDSCCDNWRVALKGNTAQIRRYKSDYNHGCCGFRDWKAVGPDGRTYLLGYNYGH